MRLSEHFTLSELTHSNIAAREGFDNIPDDDVIDNLTFLASQLEYVRSILDSPILVSSGYRCLKLNRFLGSKDTSSHVKGLAVDMTAPSFGGPKEIMEALILANVEFDQAILEFDSWVHLSFTQENPRNQALIIDRKGCRPFEITTS